MGSSDESFDTNDFNIMMLMRPKMMMFMLRIQLSFEALSKIIPMPLINISFRTEYTFVYIVFFSSVYIVFFLFFFLSIIFFIYDLVPAYLS